jgi:hypothetical protein
VCACCDGVREAVGVYALLQTLGAGVVCVLFCFWWEGYFCEDVAFDGFVPFFRVLAFVASVCGVAAARCGCCRAFVE